MPTAAFAARIQLDHVRFAVWTIPSPCSAGAKIRRRPSSLYTFPAEFVLRAWLGIAISGFPEFGQFCIAGFPASTQVFLKSAAYAIPPRPRGLAVYRFVS
jgi:hypothetical protein